MTRTFFILVYFVSMLSCTSRPLPEQHAAPQNQERNVQSASEVFAIDTVLNRITCVADPTLSFALYLPPQYASQSQLPAILFFDPHGDGSLPVKKYQQLAKEFGFVLMGSNDAKNGMVLSQTEVVASAVIKDVLSRLHADPKRLALCGFSGGAKVALSYAISHQGIAQVVYAGASIPLQKTNPSLSLIGFAGTGDMNYTDLLGFDRSVALTNMQHYLVEWNGKHEWPDTATFRKAFYYLAFDNMRKQAAQKDEMLVNRFITAQEIALQKDNNPLAQAMLLNETVQLLYGIAKTDAFSMRLQAVETKPSYKTALQEKESMLKQEEALKQMYYSAFTEKDLAWWNQEIARLNSNHDQRMQPMYQRLLGFISLAGYTISGNAIRQNEWETAKKMLSIYKLADPSNSDQPFLEACLYAKLGEDEKAINALKDAVGLGLHDPAKLLNEPALATLQSNPDFTALLNNLNK